MSRPIDPKKHKPGCQAYDVSQPRCSICLAAGTYILEREYHVHLCATSLCYQPKPKPEPRYFVELEVPHETYDYIMSSAPLELWGLAPGGEEYKLPIERVSRGYKKEVDE